MRAANACVLAAVWFDHGAQLVVVTVSGIGTGIPERPVSSRLERHGRQFTCPRPQRSPVPAAAMAAGVFASNRAALRYYSNPPGCRRPDLPGSLSLAEGTLAADALEPWPATWAAHA